LEVDGSEPKGSIFGVKADALRDIVLKAGMEIGVYLTPHDLRRSYARLAYERGVSADHLQDALGHASPVTTRGYIGEDKKISVIPGNVLDMRIDKKVEN
jgi:integrase